MEHRPWEERRRDWLEQRGAAVSSPQRRFPPKKPPWKPSEEEVLKMSDWEEEEEGKVPLFLESGGNLAPFNLIFFKLFVSDNFSGNM